MITEELEDCERYEATSKRLISRLIVYAHAVVISGIVGGVLLFTGKSHPSTVAFSLCAIFIISLVVNDRRFWKNAKNYRFRLAEIKAKYDKELADLTSGK